MAQDAQPWHMVDSLAFDFMVRLGNAGRPLCYLLKPADPVFLPPQSDGIKKYLNQAFLYSLILGELDVAGAFDYRVALSSN